jgi:cysteine-rich repeat protein
MMYFVTPQNISTSFLVILLLLSLTLVHPAVAAVTIGTATTTINLSICGNGLVDVNEQCDVPGETGQYSTTIAGRQCTPVCQFGPYCGDGILQTQFGEECDDGNNENGDFCSASCRIEPAGSGGGGSSGGGSGGSGGSQTQLGDTVVRVTGIAYPNQTINFLLDNRTVGTIRSNASGQFVFSLDAAPGTATLGIWANDSAGRRSITHNSTFDVTQGAVTNVSGVILPPTLAVQSQNISPGSPIQFSGQAVPNAQIEIHFNNSQIIATTSTNGAGIYSLAYNSSSLRPASYTVRARSVTGNPPLIVQSNFSSTLQLFVGVDGQASTPSDLNRDGKVNLIDFSILIFWWGSAGGSSDPPADINQNGRVGLEDFSILLFNWTG